jgi:hypothetical protein
VVVAGALLLGACSAGKQVSDRIEASLKDNLGVDIDVECPKDAKAKRGTTFDCTASLGEAQLVYHIAFRDSSHFTANPAGRADTAGNLASEVRRVLEAQGLAVSGVDCGADPLLVPSGGTFQCEVTADGQTVKVRSTVDANGKVADAQPVS